MHVNIADVNQQPIKDVPFSLYFKHHLFVLAADGADGLHWNGGLVLQCGD